MTLPGDIQLLLDKLLTLPLYFVAFISIEIWIEPSPDYSSNHFIQLLPKKHFKIIYETSKILLPYNPLAIIIYNDAIPSAHFSLLDFMMQQKKKMCFNNSRI